MVNGSVGQRVAPPHATSDQRNVRICCKFALLRFLHVVHLFYTNVRVAYVFQSWLPKLHWKFQYSDLPLVLFRALKVERRNWIPWPPCVAPFSRMEYIGPIMAAPMTGVTVRASILCRALVLLFLLVASSGNSGVTRNLTSPRLWLEAWRSSSEVRVSFYHSTRVGEVEHTTHGKWLLWNLRCRSTS